MLRSERPQVAGVDGLFPVSGAAELYNFRLVELSTAIVFKTELLCNNDLSTAAS